MGSAPRTGRSTHRRLSSAPRPCVHSRRHHEQAPAPCKTIQTRIVRCAGDENHCQHPLRPGARHSSKKSHSLCAPGRHSVRQTDFDLREGLGWQNLWFLLLASSIVLIFGFYVSENEKDVHAFLRMKGPPEYLESIQLFDKAQILSVAPAEKRTL